MQVLSGSKAIGIVGSLGGGNPLPARRVESISCCFGKGGQQDLQHKGTQSPARHRAESPLRIRASKKNLSGGIKFLSPLMSYNHNFYELWKLTQNVNFSLSEITGNFYFSSTDSWAHFLALCPGMMFPLHSPFLSPAEDPHIIM